MESESGGCCERPETDLQQRRRSMATNELVLTPPRQHKVSGSTASSLERARFAAAQVAGSPNVTKEGC